ncbi:MAG: hypothetical protein IT452_05605 [Planctomycetia bacterium]|nr:hypothetical protein [Planctomycetia bacterium]
MKKPADATTHARAQSPSAKKTWRAPRLRAYGSLAALTAKGSFGGDRSAKKT